VLPDNKNVISLRQRMIDRIIAEENLLQNLSHHYGIDISAVKTWLADYYSDEMLRSLIVGLDRLEKAKEEEKEMYKMSPGPFFKRT
jgi:hypothetical protein